MRPKFNSYLKTSIILFILFILTIPSHSQNPWVQDLEYFAKELPKRHKNLFFSLSEEKFKEKVSKLKQNIPNLKDYEIIVEMQKIVAEIGDSHTNINPFRTDFFHKLPIGISWFSDGLYIISAAPEYEDLLGKRLIGINGIPIDEVNLKIRSIIPHENEAQVMNQSPKFIIIPEILAAFQIIETPDSATILVESAGERMIYPKNLKEKLNLISVLDNINCTLPLYLQNRGKNYWATYLPENNVIYIQYNRCREMKAKPFSMFKKELLKQIDSNPVNKLVFDMRFNGGGNSSIADPLIKKIKKRKNINQRGHLFVIIGRKTFSSAILNSLHFKNKTKAIFVGEATGGKPNHYGEVKFLTLPNSKIIVTYSTKYFTHLAADPPSLVPDIKVERSFSDFISCKDPAFDAILNYKNN